MKDTSPIERLLVEINSKLDLIVASHMLEFRKIVNDNYLTTKKRAEMYELFDGNHSMQDISMKLKVTIEAVRQLKIALERDKLITVIKRGKTEYPIKLI